MHQKLLRKRVSQAMLDHILVHLTIQRYTTTIFLLSIKIVCKIAHYEPKMQFKSNIILYSLSSFVVERE